jgi:trimethylamine---corrinoid protein Co-methyltransferase
LTQLYDGPRPRVNVLVADQCQAIHQASLEVLQRTGYEFPVGEAQDVLRGASVQFKGRRALIPPDLVAQALESLRPAILHDRMGRPSQVLQRGHVGFGGLADTFYFRDPRTQQVRSFLKEDQISMTTVLDALPNIDWIQVVGQSQDVPNDVQTQLAYAQSVQYTVKPILVYPYDRTGLLDVLDVAKIIAGSEKAFRERPFVFCASVPNAPLSGSDFNTELILTCAECEVPLLYYSCPAIGGNSPASLVGSLVLATADWLGALVLHQLKHPGAPVCTFGFTMQLMEMRTLIWSYNAPEMQLAYAAITDLAHWYGLSAWGIVMESDFPLLDAQAGTEMSAATLWAMMSGTEMIHNIGRSGAGKLVSPEAAILADEIISFTRSAVRPLTFSDEELQESAQIIEAVGPAGEYVTLDHTCLHFRDFWYPSIFDRAHFDPLSHRLGSDINDRLNARANNLLDKHEVVPLDERILAEVESLQKTWVSRSL